MTEVTYEFPRPIVTVDVVLFTVVDEPGEDGRIVKRVKVALVPRRTEPFTGIHALPGTYLRIDETTDGVDEDLADAAVRCLRVKCGLPSVLVEQLKTYSGANRDPRGWSVTTAYYALVRPSVFEQAADDVVLYDVSRLQLLPFDHARIVADGLDRIRGLSTYTTLPTLLVPAEFSLPQLEDAYEAVLGRRIHTTFFRKKMFELTVLVGDRQLPYLRDTGRYLHGSGRPAKLYTREVDGILAFPQRF